jgi:GDP-mannose 6-dehydrogenase
VGVDLSPDKTDLINRGESPIVEPGLENLLQEGWRAERLRGTKYAADAVADSDISFICVGTPSKKNGDLDVHYIESVCEEIGAALRDKDDYHLVVVRSTVLPGTVKKVVIPALEKSSGKRAGDGFGVAVNPEFLREGTAVSDYDHPPITVIGELDPRSGNLLQALYEELDAPIVRKSIEVAEMIKYTCNVWHAAKVTFANEIGNIAKAAGVDGREVMEVVCQDAKLNLSRYYMRPGFAFGGSCLPKDVRALNYRAGRLDVETPLLGSLMRSNAAQVRRAFDLVTSHGELKPKSRIGLFGLSFKAATDDLRESPQVALAEMLIGKGHDLAIYDHNVEYARVFGANKAYIESKIPHVSSLLDKDFDRIVERSEVIVIGNADEGFRRLVDAPPPGKRVVDLVGCFMPRVSGGGYEGICW